MLFIKDNPSYKIWVFLLAFVEKNHSISPNRIKNCSLKNTYTETDRQCYLDIDCWTETQFLLSKLVKQLWNFLAQNAFSTILFK